MQFAVAFFGFGFHVIVRSIAFKWLPWLSVTHSLSIVLISNSSYKEVRGTALGLGQVIGGLCRFLVRPPPFCQF